jgi:hypothetical protein
MTAVECAFLQDADRPAEYVIAACFRHTQLVSTGSLETLRMRRSFVLLLAILVPIMRPALQAQRTNVVSHLSWISGCWQQTGANGRLVEEQWMGPRGNTMMGMSRTVRGDSLVEYEQLRIGERAGKAVYYALPSGQSPSEFTAATVSDTMVVFENPQHDFPQRIIYRKRGADSLVARVEGTMNGRSRGVDFPYGKVQCGQ